MYPSISIPSATRFSSVSVKEISDHLSRYKECISTEMMTPRQGPTADPTAAPEPPVNDPDESPARITFRRQFVGSQRDRVYRVSGRVLSSAGTPIGAVKLNLVVQDKTVAKVVTNEKGEYQVLVKFSVPRGREVYTYMETADGMVFSRFIWVGASRR